MSVRADFTLEVGALTERVQVTSQAPMLDASTPTITAQLTTKQIHDLPIITVGRKRDITQYLLFLPGVENAINQGAGGSLTQTAKVNGSQMGNTELFLDGAPASLVHMQGGVQENGPAVEQAGEFSIVTNAFNAEYGKTGTWPTKVTI